MTTYILNFRNETPDTWTFCVYQALPDFVDLDSLAWKQTTVPPNGVSGVQWNNDFQVCLAGYKQVGGRGGYTSAQRLETGLGTKWACVYQDGVQQLRQTGTTTSGQISIVNNSMEFANLGIGMDGDIALVKRNVYSGNNVQFVVNPKYYVALFSGLTKGEIISGNQSYGPLEIVFDGGQTSKNYVARTEGSTIVFEEVTG